MMERPLISVIIPVFNGARYLAEAIESVNAQDYRPIEIIVVDDGSTDESRAVAASFVEVKLLALSHQGAGPARNAGVKLAQGSILAFLDADDIWTKNKLSLQAAVLEDRPDVDAVFGHIQQFHSPELTDVETAAIQCPELAMPGPIPSTMFIRREAFERAGSFHDSGVYGETLEWYLRAKEIGLNIFMHPEVLARRRLHGDNFGVREPNVQAYLPMLKAFLDRRRSALGKTC